MMELKLPRELIKWIDEQRGGLSREAFIVSNMIILMNKCKQMK